MKILYALANHPQLSEMYVEAELNFVEKAGVETAVWSKGLPGSPYNVTRKVYNGSLAEAESDFKPDFVHLHWTTLALEHVNETKAPVTVRGHSFDFNLNRLNSLAAMDRVKAIFLFPHQAAAINNDKIVPLKVGYDTNRYYPVENKNKKQVIRCCAARPSKGLNDYVLIAKMCPDFNFILCVAEVYGDPKFMPNMIAYAKNIGSPVQIRGNVPPDEMSELMRTSGISLHTLDLPQNVGMCISVAEGMASGSYSLVRNTVPLNQMIQNVGHAYNRNEEAVALINATKTWNDAAWDTIKEKTSAKALEYADFNVFPALIQKWNSI